MRRSLVGLAALIVALVAAAALGEGQGAEQRDMRLVGHEALQGRSAYQPLPRRQKDRVIVYVGHHAGTAPNPLTGRDEPNGTSIVDATDPAKPVYLHHLPARDGEKQAQMVQVCDGSALPHADRSKTYMLRTNGDRGHEVWDVTDPQRPAAVSTVQDGLRATHKNWWDCATGMAYLVSDGRPLGWRTERLLQIFDLSDPATPRHVREIGLPGQEPGSTGPVPPGLHEATVLGKRLYLGWGTSERGVIQILDRETFRQVGRIDMPPYWGAHTAWPVLGVEVPEYRAFRDNRVRDILIVTSEAIAPNCQETHHPIFFLDITAEATPFPIATFQVPESSGKFCSRGGRFGAHSINWSFNPLYYKKLVFASYFNAGVRAIDIRDPFRPTEVAFFIPEKTANTKGAAIQTNNVEVDDRGLVYLADRAGTGLHIVELTGAARAIVQPGGGTGR